MAQSDGHTVEVGKLRFKIHYRHFGADEGPAVEVYAEVRPAEWREVARYDCFAQDPHRHFFHADGKEDRKNLGTATVAESVCVCVDELQVRLPAILERLGYPELAAGLGPEVRPAIDQVDTRLRAFPS